MRSVSKYLAIAICLVSGSAFAANFSGKWAIKIPAGRGGDATVILQLNQVGNTVTGTISPARVNAGAGSPVSNEIFDPKVEGDTISFYVWRGQDRPTKQTYKGTISGDEINFTITGGQGFGPAQAQPTPVQAKATRTP